MSMDKFGEEVLKLVNSAADFAAIQIPDVVQQLLRFKMADAIFWAVLSVACLVMGLFLIRWTCKNLEELDELSIPAFLGFSTLTIVGLCGSINNSETALQISMAPKVYLIEYASELVKDRCHK